MKHRIRTPLLATTLWCMASLATAHDAGAAIPAQPGAQLGTALAVHYIDAQQRWPATSLPGVLGVGDVPTDQRQGYLEHGSLQTGVRLHERIGASWGLGWHGSDPVHVENAWVELRPGAQSEWALGAGRNRVPVGQVIDAGGHFDNLASQPLAKRAVFNGDWIEDGVNLSWQPHRGGWLRHLERVDLGLWHTRRFPGSENASWSPVLRARLRLGQTLALDGFASRIQARDRGSYTLRPEMGHSHAVPDCRDSLREVSCFDGDVTLAGAAFEWATPIQRLHLQGAALWRGERGELYGQASHTHYRGRTRAAWLDAHWQLAPQWRVALRQEWLRASHHLEGSGASLVARDAGLLPNRAASRSSMALSWSVRQDLQLSLEAGSERIAGQRNAFGGVRLLWQPEPWLRAHW